MNSDINYVIEAFNNNFSTWAGFFINSLMTS